MTYLPDHSGPDPGHAHQLSRRMAFLRVLLFLRLAARLRRGLTPMRFVAEED